ncbi:hypothetical protein RQP46_004682 [Phenoliferia psychrophenolica]
MSSPHSHSGSSRAGSPCSIASTAASSLLSQSPDHHDSHVHDLELQTFTYVRQLLKEKREADVQIAAWRIRCETLEGEVERLAGLMGEMEAREVARKRISSWGSPDLPPSPPLSSPTLLTPPSSSDGNDPNLLPDTTTRICTDWRAACQKNQPIPIVDPSKSMSKQNPPPCNSFYLCGSCSVPRCKFHQCNAIKNGQECTDPTCCYGHVCPRGSSCGRTNCAFNDEQHRCQPSVRPLLRRL